MKIDFSQIIKGWDGKPLEGENSMDLTLKEVCLAALENVNLDDKQGLDRIMRWALGTRIYASDEVQVTPEELAFLRKLVKDGFKPQVAGPSYGMLEGKVDTPAG